MNLSDTLRSILQRGEVSTVWQPIYEIQASGRRRLHLLESLSRAPAGLNCGEGAELFFAYVRRKGQEPEMDRICAQAAIRQVAQLGQVPGISINVHAATLSRDPRFIPFLATACDRASLDPSKVVLEILEHAPAWGRGHFVQALKELRRTGMRVALDDLGTGETTFRMILDTEPDYLKLDSILMADGRENDRNRRALVASLLVLGEHLGARVIAEGVERSEELSAVRDLGIPLAQGYFLGRPLPAPATRSACKGEVLCSNHPSLQ